MFNGLPIKYGQNPTWSLSNLLQRVQVLLYSNKNANQFMTFIQYIFSYGYVVDILSLSIKTNREKNLP